jgi:hypothetical protein
MAIDGVGSEIVWNVNVERRAGNAAARSSVTWVPA